MRNVWSVSVVAVFCAGGAWAQSVAEFGSVTGTVYENTVDGLPDCMVVVSNEALGIQWTTSTSDDGVFFAPALVPAPGYRIKVKRTGFADWQSSEFEVYLGRTLNFTVDMVKGEGTAAKGRAGAPRGGGTAPQKAQAAPAPSAAPATITNVQAASVLPLVNDSKTGINTLFTIGQLEALPSPARRMDTLVEQAPLVNTLSSNGQIAYLGVLGSNSFLIDGIDITNSYYGERPGVGIANQLSESAIAEMQVMSADAPGEFGRYMGGEVNAITRSGSNSFHGSAEDHLRPNSMTAAERFAPGQNLLGKQNQVEAAVGGPIWADKIFFFADAQQLSGHFDGLNRITNPLIVDPTWTTVAASNCKATAAQCAAATRFIQSQMNVLEAFSERWLGGVAKIDYRRSDRNQFSVEGNALNLRAPLNALNNNVAPNGGLLGLNNSIEQTRYAKVGWLSTPLPKAFNELRLGYYQDRWTDPASTTQLSTGNLGISLAGTTIGAPHPYPNYLSERRYQVVDNFTMTSGSHTLRVGGDLSRRHDWIDELENASGTYYYNSLTAFAQDFSSPTSIKNYVAFTQQFGIPNRSLGVKDYNLYAQDTWKVATGFIVTAGARWDRPVLPQPTATNSSYYETGSVSSPYNDFSPRVGASYMINDRTVLRVGFGYFFAPYPGPVVDALYLGNGLYQTNIVMNPSQTGASAFPNIYSSTVTTTNPPVGSINIAYSAGKLRNPKTQQTTAALEKRLNRATVLTVSLFHTRGFRLFTADDVNMAAFTETGTYVIDNAAGQQTGTYTADIYTAKTNTNFAHIYEIQNGGSSWYYGGNLELRSQLPHGLSLLANYTFSHGISDNNGPPGFAGIPQNLYNNDSGQDKGNSLTDQRQRGTVNWIWQPRLTGSTSPLARFVVNGWQLSGVTTVAAGEPETVTALPLGQQFTDALMLYPTSLNGSGGWARLLYNGISTLKTEPQYSLDVRVSRTLPFTERIHGTLMFEAFNVLNRQFATMLDTLGFTGVTSLPAGAVSGPLSGVIKPVAGVGTPIAAGGYPDGTSARRLQVGFRLVF